MENKTDIGFIGLAVMGENLIMNMESKGYTVAVFNRTVEKVDSFVNGRGKGKNIVPCHSLQELVNQIQKPRKVFMMVKSGAGVDDLIDQLLEYLEEGDIIIDGGNSDFRDTVRRTAFVESKGLFYIGTGVSGGEEGALKGPSLMPGGSCQAWPFVETLFKDICAKTETGYPCCEWIGKDGAGHFVKMVHNGIEYGDMQVICEAYQLMRDGLKMSVQEMQGVFESWRDSELNSYLISITGDILGYRDENNNAVVDLILDSAGQKGTGKWTVINALEEGIPLTLIGEAVFARCLSAMKDERVEAAKKYLHEEPKFDGDRVQFLNCIRKALFASKIMSYAQGFALMRASGIKYGWQLSYKDIAKIWRGGCIIRSTMLDKICDAFTKNPDLENLLLDDYFCGTVSELIPAWRNVVSFAVTNGIPVPAFSAALEYFDGYTTERLSANLLQAQRDYFGAHTYERIDCERGQFFHTNWTGRGGDTSSSSYTV